MVSQPWQRRLREDAAARTMTAAGLESFQRTKFRVRLDSLSKTRRHRIFLIKICEIISTKEINDPTTATATLRLFFHDCMVEGYDASVLISSNSFNTAQHDADINLSLPGNTVSIHPDCTSLASPVISRHS